MLWGFLKNWKRLSIVKIKELFGLDVARSVLVTSVFGESLNRSSFRRLGFFDGQEHILTINLMDGEPFTVFLLFDDSVLDRDLRPKSGSMLMRSCRCHEIHSFCVCSVDIDRCLNLLNASEFNILLDSDILSSSRDESWIHVSVLFGEQGSKFSRNNWNIISKGWEIDSILFYVGE